MLGIRVYNYGSGVLLPVGCELSAGLVNASWGLKAAVDVIGRLLGKLWEANLLIHCG